MAGTALANVLSGKVNPSGKLPVTFAVRQQDYPCFQYGEKAYPGINGQVFYDEDIFVGYRWFNSVMNTKKVKPQFPFGHGLSYTTFKYGKPELSNNHLSSQQGSISVTLPVTNTGSVTGKEIVQLYIGDDKCSVVRPAKELKGFRKIELQPGETKNVTFQITADDLSFFDEAAAQWRVEPGKFTAYFCASETDVRQKASFTYE
jgi:beta-glucosidase